MLPPVGPRWLVGSIAQVRCRSYKLAWIVGVRAIGITHGSAFMISKQDWMLYGLVSVTLKASSDSAATNLLLASPKVGQVG
jgi:hypothetical protein